MKSFLLVPLTLTKNKRTDPHMSLLFTYADDPDQTLTFCERKDFPSVNAALRHYSQHHPEATELVREA